MLPTSSNSSTKSRLHSAEGLAQFSNVNVAFSDFEFTHGLQERQIVNRSYGIDFSQRTTLNTVTTDLPPDAYAGTYSNPGYGSFTFCSPSSNLSTTNEYCTSTLSDFSKVFSASPPSEEQGLYATWARVWASHVRALPTTAGANSSVVQNRQTYIDQTSANTFDFSFITLYPSGYGKNSTPFYDDSILIPATGIFDVVDGEVKGLGMFEDYSPPSIIKDGTLKEIAEIYFVKTG